MSSFKFTPENEVKFQEYVSRYPVIDSVMLPALWLVQEQESWVSPESMIYVADKRETPIQVYDTTMCCICMSNINCLIGGSTELYIGLNEPCFIIFCINLFNFG